MAFIQFSGPAILDNDGYYHIRWAAMLRESAPRLPAFTHLPLTTVNERDYADHHFLFHVLLMPFTYGDLRTGAKLAAAVFSSIGLASLFALLVGYRIPYRWLWLAPLVASSEPFLYRMAMTRAPGLALAMLGGGSYLILKRKLLLVGLLSFAFTWLYSLFPLILAFALAHAVAVYLAERRVDLWAAAASLSGIVLGLVINPYFPRNLVLFVEHLRMKVAADYSVPVGVEWYPYDTWVILQGSVAAFLIFFVALAAFDYRSRLRDIKPLFFLIVSSMLLLMAFKSRRFIEYWPPFAVTFAAFTLRGRIDRLKRTRLLHARDQVIAAAAASLIVVGLSVAGAMSILQARHDVQTEADPFAYRGASEWLASNTEPGTRVFNTDWDDFPMLFYYNSRNEYVAGLDPTYLYDSDPELWKLYARITLGEEPSPARLITDGFGARYVFTDNEHGAFLKIAEESGEFETVYSDVHATVLRIRAHERR